MFSSKRSTGADIQGLKLRRRMRRALVVRDDELSVMPKL
jgi:hypothetical protein